MGDSELIALMAWTWVRHGGDADGLDSCVGKLRAAVLEETKRISDDQKEPEHGNRKTRTQPWLPL